MTSANTSGCHPGPDYDFWFNASGGAARPAPNRPAPFGTGSRPQAPPENAAEQTAVIPPVPSWPADRPSPVDAEQVSHGRTLPAFPIMESRAPAEPFADQAARLLSYLATLVRAGQLPPTDLFDAIAEDTATDTFSRWAALKRVGRACRQHAETAGWARAQPADLRMPGDWLAGFVEKVPAADVAAMLTAAADTAP